MDYHVPVYCTYVPITHCDSWLVKGSQLLFAKKGAMIEDESS